LGACAENPAPANPGGEENVIGCNGEPPSGGAPTGAITDRNLLLGALTEAGIEWQDGQGFGDNIFERTAEIITIRSGENEATITVYHFHDAMDAEAGFKGISDDGFRIEFEGRATSVSWVDLPRFYKTEFTIVLYVGDEAWVIEFLNGYFNGLSAGADYNPAPHEAYDDFMMALKTFGYGDTADYSCYVTETMDGDLFSGRAETVKFIRGEKEAHITYYWFMDAEETSEQAGYVSPGGSSFNFPGRSMEVSWAGDPHFYKNDYIIVFYVGSEEWVLDFLNDYFGEAFAS
jgi:hypothetical protein